MGRLSRTLAAAAITALALVACGEERITTTETEAARVPGPTDTIVVYERTGGEAGVRERLDVRPDGAARVSTLNGARRVQLSPNDLNALRVARQGIDATTLEQSYGDEPAPLDSYVETVILGARTTRVLDGGKPPKELRRLLHVSQGIVRRHAPR